MAIDPELRAALKKVVAARAMRKNTKITFGVALTKSAERVTSPIDNEQYVIKAYDLEREGLLPEAEALKEYELNK